MKPEEREAEVNGKIEIRPNGEAFATCLVPPGPPMGCEWAGVYHRRTPDIPPARTARQSLSRHLRLIHGVQPIIKIEEPAQPTSGDTAKEAPAKCNHDPYDLCDVCAPEAKPTNSSCGKEFETLCNLPKGHKGLCGWEPPKEQDAVTASAKYSKELAKKYILRETDTGRVLTEAQTEEVFSGATDHLPGAEELARKAYSLDYPNHTPEEWEANKEFWTAFADTILAALAVLSGERK